MQKIWRRKIITLLMAISKRKALFDERGISVRLVRVCSSLPVNRTRTPAFWRFRSHCWRIVGKPEVIQVGPLSNNKSARRK
jgi:hypothetical protein